MSPSRWSVPIALLAIVSAALVAGCGSSGETTTTAAKQSSTAPGGMAELEAPKGASPILREINRQFPKPEPDPASPGSAAAIRAGEKACRDKTPVEVKRKFYAFATEEGTLQPNSPEGKMIGEIPRFEAKASQDSAFIAGQLAADVYGATLPEATSAYGYQGCVYALALRLKRDLAPN